VTGRWPGHLPELLMRCRRPLLGLALMATDICSGILPRKDSAVSIAASSTRYPGQPNGPLRTTHRVFDKALRGIV
jgi:hypothetical protein